MSSVPSEVFYSTEGSSTGGETDLSDVDGEKRVRKGVEGLTNPGEHDVLLGRGGGTNNHEGNIKFRKLVNEHKLRYLACSKIEKPKVAREVVGIWRKLDPPGRFLSRKDRSKKGPGSVKDASNVWYEVGDKKAREKASQCLRERTPDVLPFLKQIRDQQDQMTERGLSAIQQQQQEHQHQQQQQLQMQQEGFLQHPQNNLGHPNAMLPPQNRLPQRSPQDMFGMGDISAMAALASASPQGNCGPGIPQGFPQMMNGENQAELMNLMKMQGVAGNTGTDFPLYAQQQRHLDTMRRGEAGIGNSCWDYDNPGGAMTAAAAGPSHPMAPTSIISSSSFGNNELQLQEQKQQEQQLQLQLEQLRAQQHNQNQLIHQQMNSLPNEPPPQPQLNTSGNVEMHSPNNNFEELTSEDYRKTLEAYMKNQQTPQTDPRELSQASLDYDGYESDFTDAEVYEEVFKEEVQKEECKKKRGGPKGPRRVKRNASGKSASLMSVVSKNTHKSSFSHLSGLDNMSDMMSTDMLSAMSAREKKMNASRSLGGSNMSLMSELTDISHGLDHLNLGDE